jgi:hypothetical protein
MSIFRLNHRCSLLLEYLAYHLPHYPQVSDSSGFGTGGTSIPVAVLQSSDSSCYNSANNAEGAWVFNVDPQGGITQCESVRLWWEQEFANGCVPHCSAAGFPSSALFGYSTLI